MTRDEGSFGWDVDTTLGGYKGSLHASRKGRKKVKANSFPLATARWRKLWGKQVRKKGSAHFRRESKASQMSIDNPIALNSFITSKVQGTSVVEIGQRNASGTEGLGQVQANNSDGQSHSVGSVTSSDG